MRRKILEREREREVPDRDEHTEEEGRQANNRDPFRGDSAGAPALHLHLPTVGRIVTEKKKKKKKK